MKVLLLAPLPPPTGGIASWTKRMIHSNLKNGWSVDVVDEKVLVSRSKKNGKNKFKLFKELRRTLHIWKELISKTKDKDVKVVHSCIPAYEGAMFRELICCKIAHLRKKKFVVHFRCTVPNAINTKRGLRLFKKLMKKADSTVLLNNQSLGFCNINGFSKNLFVVPNFVSESELFFRKNYNDSIKRIVYTGRIFKDKGCLDIISVAKVLPHIEFRLIGPVFVKTDNLPKNVVLLGESNKEIVSKELEEADVFIFLSRFKGEGFSNSLAEAMAHSLPCIVSDWAANKDMVGDGGGIVLNVNDINDMSICDAISSIENVGIRRKMGLWNYTKVSQNYLEKAVVDKYVDIYEGL